MTKLGMVRVVWVLGLTLPAIGETVSLAPPDAVIAYGKTGEYAFTPPAGSKSVRLLLALRMDSPECSGSTHSLRLTLNGRALTGALDRAHSRLLNKPLSATMASGLAIPWVRNADWRVVYAPDFTIVGTAQAGPMRIPDVSPYRLVLDVTDLVVVGAENRLVLAHRGEQMRLRSYFPKLNPSLDFVLAELAMDFSQDPPVGKPSRREEPYQADRLMLQPPATVDIRNVVRVAPGGGLALSLPGLALQVESRFSHQGGGYHALAGEGQPPGQPEWQVKVSRATAECLVDATAKEYRLERRITFVADHLEITDRLTNLTGEAIGLAFDNRLVAVGSEIAEAWLGGNPDPAVTRMEALENSSVFVAGAQSGCGLLVVDDVYRIQSILYYDNGAGARSDTFALGPGASYTLRWHLYPVLRPDYYDFINLARRDLDVNFTLPGGFQFGLGAGTDDDYRALADQRGLQFMSSGVWMNSAGPVKCYHGAHLLEATALQQNLRERCASIRRVLPQVKSLVYIHAFINTDPAGPLKYADARIMGEDGAQYENKTYTEQCGIPFLYNYPALDPENSYVAAMKRVIDLCLDSDKIGADGVYWDELDWTSPRYTFDRWDGHSAQLDEQHRIKRKMAYVHLLSRSAKVALINYISSKGGVLIGNSVATSDTLTKLHFPRFVETAEGWFPARSHLYSPIALGDHLTVKDFPGLVADIRAKLMWGTVYYYYATPKQPYGTITQHMFPFTPVELHHGWLLGKERLLTAVPGTFTLGDEAPVRVYWYDAAGKLGEKRGEERLEGGRRWVRLALADGEMAAIVRGE
jgi:hypothetical protein